MVPDLVTCRPRWLLPRAAFVVLILGGLLLSGIAGSVPVQAAPASQQQRLCRLLPGGSFVEDDTPTHCSIQYQESDGSYYAIELSLFSSPDSAYGSLNPNPFDCSVGASSSLNCFPLDLGDEAPPGYGNSYKGVTYSLLSSSDTAAAWRRGCYLLKGATWYLALKDKMMQALLKLDAQLTTTACAGCADPSTCQPSGTGSGTGGTTSVCGPGVPAPAGTFAVSGYGCQYEEASDGVTCQAALVNACPDAQAEYEWKLDGAVVAGFAGDVFNPTGLGLCAGEHTVLVSARDTKNNLSAAGTSWTFTSTHGHPCSTGTGGSFTVATPACSYASSEDRIMCLTQVVDAPAGSDIEYEWTWNGVVQAETGAMLDILVSPDFQIHTFQVRARDKVSGQASPPASTTVQVGTPPLVTNAEYIRVETPSGPFEFAGSGGSMPEKLVLLPPDQLSARVLAICPEMAAVLLLNLGYDMTIPDVSTGTSPMEAIIASLVLKCGGLKAEVPLQVAALDDAALFLPAQTAPEDLPVQLRIEMLGGPLRVNVAFSQVLLDVQTSEASVRSVGENEFGIAFDAQTGDTTVAVNSGSVEVYSMRDGLRVAALGAGDQVTVSQGKASQVSPSSTSEGASRAALAVLGCLAGLAVLAGLVIWAIVRSRKKKRAAPPRAAAPLPAANRPAAPSGPRLVVSAGKASTGMVDLSRGPVTIGRHPSNTLVVYDALVSDQHAQVGYQNGFWVLMDLGSRTGTLLNGVRIQRQALRSGDRVQVGQTVIVFQAGA